MRSGVTGEKLHCASRCTPYVTDYKGARQNISDTDKQVNFSPSSSFQDRKKKIERSRRNPESTVTDSLFQAAEAAPHRGPLALFWPAELLTPPPSNPVALGQRAESLSENSLSSSGHSGALHICAQRRTVLRGNHPSFAGLCPHFIYCSQLHKESLHHATNTDASAADASRSLGSTPLTFEHILKAFPDCLIAVRDENNPQPAVVLKSTGEPYCSTDSFNCVSIQTYQRV